MFEVRPARFAGFVALCLLVVMAIGNSTARPALAATGVSGQIESWENIEFGEGPGELLYGEGEAVGGFGVDPIDGSTYIISNNVGSTQARIDKFTSAGAFEGSVAIPRPPGAIVQPVITGIAVDHAEHRLYVVRGEDVSPGPGAFGEAFVAEKLLAYSTEVTGEQLEQVGEYALPGPTEAGAVFNTTELHADQSTGELVLSGINAAEEPVLQRLSPTGVEEGAYVEAGTSLKPAFFAV